MNVLITGGAGFIGSHLAEAMLARGHAVTVVDDLSTGREENLADVGHHEPMRFVRGSVRDEPLMSDLVKGADAVFHLAAAVGVKLIAEDPVHTIETNIHGTEVVLAEAARHGRRVLIASTSEVYGKNARTPFREDDDCTLGPTRYSRWSYACSKMVDEFLGLAYHDQFGLPTVVCRLFNTIGPRQTVQYGMVVPRFVRWALAGEPVQVYGDGTQSRCFCHVADVVAALAALIDCPQAVGQVVNVGNDESVTIDALADLVLEKTGSTGGKVYVPYADAYGRPIDDLRVRKPDLTRARELIGYRPHHTLAQTLDEVIAWQRTRPAAESPPDSVS